MSLHIVCLWKLIKDSRKKHTGTVLQHVGVLSFDFFKERLVSFQLFLVVRFKNKYNTSRSLGLCSSTEFHSGSDKDVRDSLMLAKNGNVGENINWTNITSENDNTAIKEFNSDGAK